MLSDVIFQENINQIFLHELSKFIYYTQLKISINIREVCWSELAQLSSFQSLL